jgi:hypothetical protein
MHVSPFASLYIKRMLILPKSGIGHGIDDSKQTMLAPCLDRGARNEAGYKSKLVPGSMLSECLSIAR